MAPTIVILLFYFDSMALVGEMGTSAVGSGSEISPGRAGPPFI